MMLSDPFMGITGDTDIPTLLDVLALAVEKSRRVSIKNPTPRVDSIAIGRIGPSTAFVEIVSVC
jgi:hypothetical protein